VLRIEQVLLRAQQVLYTPRGISEWKLSMTALRLTKGNGSVRERLLAAAYDLFSVHGINQVGIDTILEKSGCAKASLYNNFDSKEALAIAYLERRDALWTRAWFLAEVQRRARRPRAQLLAIFDVFEDWFQRRNFAGCPFINVLLESAPDGAVRREAAAHLASVRTYLRKLARAAGLADTDKFAQALHMLMKGCVVAACEGQRNAARDAKEAARLLMDGWKKAKSAALRD
jgi:AcrR family transcriptional regulator